MRILNFKINGQKLEKTGDFSGIIRGSRKYLKCRLIETGVSVTNDKFFLLSQTGLYVGNAYSDSPEGSPYPYFANYSDYSDYTSPNSGADKNRIKYWSGNPRFYYSRTSNPSGANYVCGIDAAGKLYYYKAAVRITRTERSWVVT